MWQQLLCWCCACGTRYANSPDDQPLGVSTAKCLPYHRDYCGHMIPDTVKGCECPLPPVTVCEFFLVMEKKGGGGAHTPLVHLPPPLYLPLSPRQRPPLMLRFSKTRSFGCRVSTAVRSQAFPSLGSQHRFTRYVAVQPVHAWVEPWQIGGALSCLSLCACSIFRIHLRIHSGLRQDGSGPLENVPILATCSTRNASIN